MKREFLTGLGVDASVIDQIMAENGKDVEGLKAQLSVQKGLVTDLTGKLNTANEKISEYEKVDVSKLTSERDDYKTKYENALKDKDTAIAGLRYETALDGALAGYKFSSSFAKTGIRNILMEKKLELKDGKFEKFDETMKEIMDANKDAFVVEGTKPQFSTSVQNRSTNVSDSEYLANKYKDNPWYK